MNLRPQGYEVASYLSEKEVKVLGIYLIKNRINGKCYVGQSRNIQRRWIAEKGAAFNPNVKAYNYPLSKAIRKYGVENFEFTVLEKCQFGELNQRECFWINELKPEYNQTSGGNYQVFGKLNFNQVQEIQETLSKESEEKVKISDIANKFGVSVDTIRNINAGRSWRVPNLTYPLRVSKFDFRRTKPKKPCCQDCGVQVWRESVRCNNCENARRRREGHGKSQTSISSKISKEELKSLIRQESFTSIGKKFGVSDNAIRKWCDYYSLPKRKRDIKNFPDEAWKAL